MNLQQALKWADDNAQGEAVDKVVTDRLKFLTGLEAILFDAEPKKRLKERSQLHRIIAQNCWLFGEEYNLSVDDQSLTEVLRKHKKLLGDDLVIDEPVKHITKTRGIVDLMLSKAIRQHRANTLTHLVIELKAPTVKINDDEVTQIEKYAFSVMKDERFRNVDTTWVFWAISDDLGDYATQRISDSSGLIYTKANVSIYVKTWGQVLDENRSRLQFFQERLEYQADREAVEKGPEELQLIFEEVLNLPKRKQEELAELLRDVSLSAIIGAARLRSRKVAKVLAATVRTYAAWIREEGERNNTCTFNVLGEVCGYCECKRKPSNAEVRR